VLIAFSEEELSRKTKKLLWINVTIVISILVALTLSTALIINHLLRRPIEQLISSARSFGKEPHVNFTELPQTYREFLPLLTVLAQMEEQINRQMMQLKQSEERFRQVAMTNWVWEVDLDGRYIYCSENVKNSMGYSAEEMLGKTPFDFMVAEEAERVEGIFTEVVTNRKPIVDLENWSLTKEGVEICLLTNGTPFFDKEGNCCGYRGADKDITDWKLAEQELAKYRDHLEVLVEERTKQLKAAQDDLIQGERLATLGKLTATVSHELQNPLATIQNALFSINIYLMNEKYSQLNGPLEMAERNIKRCVNIIEELNSHVRVKELDISEVSVGDWLRSVVMEQIVPEEINCDLDLSGDIRATIDQEKLRQVTVNLISNAIDALQEKNSDDKQLLISTHLLGNEYEIRCRDNGIGIPEDVKEKIFDPLFSTKNFGVGLGMVVVKNIVEQHQGEITIESKQGEGTTIILRLPKFIEKG
jgi:PAS domain S-box-containing protein